MKWNKHRRRIVPINREVKDSESYNIRKLDDGTWILGIHGKSDFAEFSYDSSKELLSSLEREIGGEKTEKKEKKEKTGFKKMMEDEENEDEE